MITNWKQLDPQVQRELAALVTARFLDASIFEPDDNEVFHPVSTEDLDPTFISDKSVFLLGLGDPRGITKILGGFIPEIGKNQVPEGVNWKRIFLSMSDDFLFLDMLRNKFGTARRRIGPFSFTLRNISKLVFTSNQIFLVVEPDESETAFA